MSSLIDYIEKLRYYSSTSMKNIQGAKIPTIYNMSAELRPAYYYLGQSNSMNVASKSLYLVQDLPICVLKRPTYIDTMSKLVASNEIQPFLLFADGKFVKWSNIQIIRDTKYSYLLISNLPGNLQTKITVVLLPLGIKYTENVSASISGTIFLFDSTGKCVTTATAGSTRVDLVNPSVYYEAATMVPGTRQAAAIDSKYKVSPQNLIFFKNGLLYTTGTVKDLGLNVFTLDDGVYSANSIMYKLFFYIYANKSKDNILHVKNQSYVFGQILSAPTIPDYINELAIPFDLQFDKTKSYEENITDSINYIMGYNSSLLNGLYQDTSNITSMTYTGQAINKLKDASGYVTMSRRLGGNTDNYPIIFVNGKLYNSYSLITYKGKDFKFPVIGIVDTDTVEVVFFKNADNRIHKVNLSTALAGDIHVMDSTVDISNMKVFSTEIASNEYNLPQSEWTQYEVPTTMSRISKNEVRITPGNPYYYNRNVSIVSQRQFRYYYTSIREEGAGITLSQEFAYCNDLSRYMVFVNGRKIDKANYKLTLIKPTRPFDSVSVFMNIPLQINDKVEVFYVPEPLEEISVAPSIPLSGTVYIDKTKVSYNLSKNLHLLFLNGKKINNKDLVDIDTTKMKIVNNVGTVNNLSIIKHVPDDAVLQSVFNNTQDSFNRIMSQINSSELDKLYTQDTAIVDSETNIQQNLLDMKLVIQDMIRTYWLRPDIMSDRDIFLYDYDESTLTVSDPENNLILDTIGEL